MDVLVELNPATHEVTAIHQLMSGESSSSPWNINLFGDIVSLGGQCNCVCSFWARNDACGDAVFCSQEQRKLSR
jgi:hypothetical protein